jgi:hypothetical protein
MAYDENRAAVVLFDCVAGQTWEWDGAAWTACAVSGSPASDNRMVYDSTRGVLLRLAVSEIWELATGCPGDLTGDSVTDLSDLATLLGDYDCVGPGVCLGDTDCDGDTDLDDLSRLLANYGSPCP